MGVHDDEVQSIKAEMPDQLLWMRINMGIMSVVLAYMFWKAKCMNLRSFGCTKFFELWLALI